MLLRPFIAGLLAATVQATPSPALATTVQFPAIERPAVAVRSPERVVLLAAAMAGPRTVAVGERGVVALSDDLGKTWHQAASVPASVTLTALQFVDSRTGWAVGHGGVVLKTEDGGDTWRRQVDGRSLASAALDAAKRRLQERPGDREAERQVQSARALVDDGPDKPLFDLQFTDARHGRVIGAYGLFFETSDGGQTWTPLMHLLANPKSAHLHAIRVVGSDIYIAGEQGVMFRSLDGGKIFESVASPYQGSWFGLFAPGNGVLVATGLRGNVVASHDRGLTWGRVEGAPPVSVFSGVSLPDGAILLSNQAGQLLRLRNASVLTPVEAPPLPPIASLLRLPDGALLAVGMAGALRLPTTVH